MSGSDVVTGSTAESSSSPPVVRWHPDRPPVVSTCPVCGAVAEHPIELMAIDQRNGEPVDFHRCDSCASMWPSAVEPLEYSRDEALWHDARYRQHVHHALELVSELTRQVQQVEALGLEPGQSFLEVGCNAGILSSYVATMWAAHVEGVEPSVFGEMARTGLGLTVHRAPFDDVLVTERETFDVIVAIEVIEHVPEPLPFLRELRRRLAPDGVALLTTPAADEVNESLDSGVLLGSLSIGGHLFLYSQAGLESHLRATGFDEFVVHREGPTLIARIGRRRFETPPTSMVAERVRQYRDRRTPPADPDPRAELGLAINRYLSHRTLDPSSGTEIEAEVERRLGDVMGIDVHDLEPVVQRVLRAGDLPEFGQAIPFRFGEFLYWRGQRADLSEEERTSMWEASLVVLCHGLRIDREHLWPLAPAVGPTVVALDRREPGRFGRLVPSLLADADAELVPLLRPPTPWSRTQRAARRAAGTLRRSLGKSAPSA